MAFIDYDWRIAAALAWVTTRDRAQVDRLDEKAARSIATAEVLVPGVREALPELISKAAAGTLSVRGRTPDGTYEWIDRGAWVHAEIQEDGHELVVRSQRGDRTTLWSTLFVRRVAVLAAWPTPLPVWPVFHGTIPLRDLASTIDPAETSRWADLRFGRYESASYDRYRLDRAIAAKVAVALASSQYRLSSDSGEVALDDWEFETSIRWADDIVERLERTRVAGPDAWQTIQTWRNVTVQCTQASLAACAPAAMTEVVRCPVVPVPLPRFAIGKRFLWFHFILSEKSCLIIGPRWIQKVPPPVSHWIVWCLRKLYWPPT